MFFLSPIPLTALRGLPPRISRETPRKVLNNEIKIRSRKFLIQSRSFELLEASIRRYQNRAIETAARELDTSRQPSLIEAEREAFYDALEVNDSAVSSTTGGSCSAPIGRASLLASDDATGAREFN